MTKIARSKRPKFYSLNKNSFWVRKKKPPIETWSSNWKKTNQLLKPITLLIDRMSADKNVVGSHNRIDVWHVELNWKWFCSCRIDSFYLDIVERAPHKWNAIKMIKCERKKFIVVLNLVAILIANSGGCLYCLACMRAK